ncbi:MAG: hypothetical protein IJ806_02570 [Ruminococcus sp.]|nr:hypothetical protein [Ruminococcus sp.]
MKDKKDDPEKKAKRMFTFISVLLLLGVLAILFYKYVYPNLDLKPDKIVADDIIWVVDI